jgi:copper chaperone NosL
MKISDSRFGAEMVTKKGKIHKYDSAECLVRTYIEQGKQDYAYTLVTDYARPNILIDATMATFLISDKQSSPMGGNLSAYEQKSQAKLVHDEKGGKLVSFLELLDEYEEIYK